MAGLVLTLLLAAIAAIHRTGGEDDGVKENPTFSSEPETPQTRVQAKMVAEAIAQFESAGLALTAVQIDFYDSTDGCGGHAGLFVPAPRNLESSIDQISICNRHKLILLHELAHVWMHYNLDDATKAAFVEHRGLASWSNSNGPYADQGIERAAQTIAVTLNQTEATDNEAIVRYICDYELLTGNTLEIHTLVDCQVPETAGRSFRTIRSMNAIARTARSIGST